MSLHNKAVKYLEGTGFLENWPDLNDLFEKTASKEHYGWVLCKASFLGLGGNPEHLIPIVAAYGCMQTSILLVDDLLDKDPNGMQHKIGIGNTANWALVM